MKNVLLALGLVFQALFLSEMAGAQTAQPTDEDTATVAQLTRTFLTALAEADHDVAYALVGEGLRGLQSEQEMRATWDAHTAQNVPFDTINLVEVTWYVDPQGLPQGAYAAVDFRGGSERVPVLCGFIVWFNDMPSPSISRIELNYIDADTFALMDDATRSEILPQFGCR